MNIAAEMQKANVHGLAVCTFDRAGTHFTPYGLLMRDGAKAVDADTLFHACSMSKMITAVCVLKLAADGVLSLDEDVNGYLTAWQLPYRDAGFAPVTLGMLLSHHAGIVDPPGSFDAYAVGEAPVDNLALLRGQTRFHPGPVTVSEMPAAQFAYSDAGYCVVRQIVEDVTGDTVDAHAKRILFDPLSLSRPFFWHQGAAEAYPLALCAVGHDASGAVVEQTRACYPNPEGVGLWISAGDMAAIVQELIRCYHGQGRILPQAQARRMMTPYVPGASGGLGVFRPDASHFISQGWGIGMQCKLVASLQEGEGIVVMMNCEPGVDQEHSIVGRIIQSVLG